MHSIYYVYTVICVHIQNIISVLYSETNCESKCLYIYVYAVVSKGKHKGEIDKYEGCRIAVKRFKK